MDEPEDPSSRGAARGRGDGRRTERLNPAGSEYEPVNPGWRSEQKSRTSARRSPRSFPTSPQEAVIWLQQGGWRMVAGAAGALVILLVLILFFRNNASRQALPRTTPTSAAIVGAGENGTTPLLPPTVTVPAQPPTPIPAAFYVVTGTGEEGLFLRPDHSVEGAPLTTIPEGTRVERVGDDFKGPDRVWRKIKGPSGQEGWAAAEFLQAAP
jgi:hypothetical protein